ncbi:MAG TPA: NEL-type E3 ubiquitin ligase domain-containing protein [Burkholderiaceae bacterium]|nr:NEL-type E3 ubiquitin ligase domain-containing protein [Burkholderiaceae bacterium]
MVDPAIGPELRQWIGRSGASREVAEHVVSALMECRNDADGKLDLNGRHLPIDLPLPDLSVVAPHARSVDLGDTDLAAVPPSLLRLSGLTDLALDGNYITHLPAGLCRMASLRHLDLRNNRLTELPEDIGRSGLVTLQVSYCNLSALPESVGQMSSLRELWIGGNPDLAGVPASLANLPQGCAIHVNREQPFRPQDLPLPAEVLFAEDPDLAEVDPGEVPPLQEGVAAWRQAGQADAAGPSSLPGGSSGPDPWDGFGDEDGAPSFAVWLHRMHATAGGDSAEVALGMNALLNRMQDQPKFRGQCFALAVDALSACEDRVAVGFGLMQAALMSSRAAAGELSPTQLKEASLQLFNRNALREFAVAHAERAGIPGEELEVALALETRLRGRLALPGGVPGMTYANFAWSQGQVTDGLVDQALAHVQARQQAPGAGGLRHFLAGQDEAGFTPWIDHLRSRHAADFEALNDKVQARHLQLAERFGGSPEAHLQAGIESKTLYRQELADLVWRLTQGSVPEGERSAGVQGDAVATFQAASSAARARERARRGGEPRQQSPRNAGPASAPSPPG